MGRRLVVSLIAVATGCSAVIGPDPRRLGRDDAEVGRLDGATSDAGPDASGSCPLGCDDGLACTDDRCEAGRCVHTPDDARCGAGELCDPTLGCVPATCTRDEECDDGRFCNGVERCEADGPTGRCAGGAPVQCDDEASCTTDACDEDLDACAFVPNDAACADPIDCTIDRCAPEDSRAASGCVHEPDDSACDTDFCRVDRTCQPDRGCTDGAPRACSDMDPCTTDTCDASLGRCVHEPVDVDRDGFWARVVVDEAGRLTICGGPDCDDGERRINPDATEVCNGVNDDCDLDTDEGCRNRPDDCGSAAPIALDASGLGRVTGRFGRLDDDYQTNAICGAQTGGRDAVYFFDLPPGRHDVEIDTIGSTANTVLGIGIRCDASGLQVACSDDFDPTVGPASRIWLHRLGDLAASLRIYVLVDAFDPATVGDYVVTVRRRDAQPDACGGSAGRGPLDISGGGTVLGLIDGSVGSARGSCEPAIPTNRPESVFRVASPADGTMRFAVIGSGFIPNLHMRAGRCASADAEIACETGNPIGGGAGGFASLVPSLPAGQLAYLFVDNGGGAYAIYYAP